MRTAESTEQGTHCDRCSREHQPRERAVPCQRCEQPTGSYHAVCAACEASDGDWVFWGRVWDRTALFELIKQMQAEGKQVRVVKNGSANVIYTRTVG
jgi:predicted amidophosphoribosyltransferase